MYLFSKILFCCFRWSCQTPKDNKNGVSAKKQKNKEEFLEKERVRRRKRYIPALELNKKDLKKRRAMINKHVKNNYRRKTETLETSIQMNELPASSGTRAKSNAQHVPLLVKLPVTIPNRAKGVRKTYQRALKRANRNVSNYIMKKDGLSGKKHVSVRRQFLLANSLFYDIKQVRKDGKLKSLLGKCKLVKKYRCVSSLSKELKIHRRTRALTGTSNKRKSKNSKRKAKVIEFLEREDNSTTLPGKKDHLKDQESREVKQKRVLTDYMHNLHEKFMLENPDVKVCRSAFYTMKPSNIVHANFSSMS
ncbi:unnamed protein product [Mytilus coruscus]|uniref:Uncharacterized protein n=1 Tax=Mytilus coruscus TaxID=42192 RepID=A0A6J8D6Z8_MYTCO|nr:unnamed protein product [Mytilus coruscus]